MLYSNYANNRNLRSSTRDKLTSFITNLTIYDVTSISILSSALKSLTHCPEELNKDYAVTILVLLYY